MIFLDNILEEIFPKNSHFSRWLIKEARNDHSVYWLYMLLCSYHVTYALQSESTLYSCLKVKEILARSRHEIWSLSDCNWTWTHNQLVHKRTLNHLAKLAKSYLYGAFDCMIVSCHVRVLESIHTLYLSGGQGTLCSKQALFANQLSGFYVMAALTFNGLTRKTIGFKSLRLNCSDNLTVQII